MSTKNKLRQKIGGRKSTRQMYADQRSHQPIELDSVRMDGGTQPREMYADEVLGEYAERMEVDDRGFVVDPQGQSWEPIVVYDDDDTLWLADGFHRVRAARSKGITSFQARVIVGSQRDAIKYSLSANARHGLRRTSQDKRRAVQRALTDDEWGAFSARALAELCSVSDFLVRQVRQTLEQGGELEPVVERVGADGKVHDVSTRTAPKKKTTKKRAATRKRSGAPLSLTDPAALTSSLEARQTSFEHLDSAHEVARSECVIAYPDGPIHFDAMRDHLHRLVTTNGALIIPLAHGRDALKGCAALDALVERGELGEPRWVVIQDTRQVALVWAPAEQELPAWSADLDALLAHIDADTTNVLSPRTS